MKRSEINSHIQEFLDFAEAQRFFFPPWALYTPEQWSRIGPEADEIRRARLGWDVTDFGSGQFHSIGLTLFTLRNGLPGESGDPAAKDYCEKIMMVREQQVTPLQKALCIRPSAKGAVDPLNCVPGALPFVSRHVDIPLSTSLRVYKMSPMFGTVVLPAGSP